MKRTTTEAGERMNIGLEITKLVSSIFLKIIPWAFTFLCVREAAHAAIAFAGQETTALASFLVELNSNINLAEILSIVFGLGGTGYGWRQKHLRGREIERLSARIKELEERDDPNRSSSGLTPRGSTNPED